MVEQMTLVIFTKQYREEKPLKKPLLKAKVKYIMTTVLRKMTKQQEAENITVEQLARTA